MLQRQIKKNATGFNIWSFAKNTELANLKSDVDKLLIDKLKNAWSGLSSLKRKVDKLNIGKLETTPVGLSKLSNLVKNDIDKKDCMMNWLKKLMLCRLLVLVI